VGVVAVAMAVAGSSTVVLEKYERAF
jgi:hypothetical protein